MQPLLREEGATDFVGETMAEDNGQMGQGAAFSADTMATEMAQLFSFDENDDSLVGSIAAWVGRAIIEGDLPPGADLNSVDLAKRFNTSRTPVREALLRLEKEGLVAIPPRRRPVVATISLHEARDVFQIRANLLALAAELSALNASEEDLERLRASQIAHRTARERQDVDEAFWTTVRFEDTVIDICGNIALKRTLAPLRLRTLRFWHVLLLENIRSQNMSDVERLVRAICDREPRLAAELYRSLILRTLRRLENKDWSGSFAAPAKRTRKRAVPKTD